MFDISKVKYSQDQINRLFIDGESSVVARAANIAADVRKRHVFESGENGDEDSKMMDLHDAIVKPVDQLFKAFKRFSEVDRKALSEYLHDTLDPDAGANGADFDNFLLTIVKAIEDLKL